MMQRFAIALLVLACLGCQRSPARQPAAAPPKPPPPAIANLPVAMKVKQRSTTEVPGSGGRISLTVDDITRGQVIASLVGEGGSVLVGPKSMKQGDAAAFAAGDQKYVLKLSELSNALVGEDYVTFEISSGTATTPLSESQKIERLIEAVADLDKAVFIRNGEEHTASEAAEHLRSKRQAAGDAIRSAAEFIEQVGSKSSLSGKLYRIRYTDGRMIPAAEFLKAELAKVEGGQ
jgi:hypothetical protein